MQVIRDTHFHLAAVELGDVIAAVRKGDIIDVVGKLIFEGRIDLFRGVRDVHAEGEIFACGQALFRRIVHGDRRTLDDDFIGARQALFGYLHVLDALARLNRGLGVVFVQQAGIGRNGALLFARIPLMGVLIGERFLVT